MSANRFLIRQGLVLVGAVAGPLLMSPMINNAVAAQWGGVFLSMSILACLSLIRDGQRDDAGTPRAAVPNPSPTNPAAPSPPLTAAPCAPSPCRDDR